MARSRSPKRNEAEKMWLDSNGKMPLIEIATQLGLGDTQIRKWKSQDKWENKLHGGKVTLPKKKEKTKSNVTNKKGSPKKSAGRPTKYKAEYTEQAYKLCLLGATDTEMANFFETTDSTINKWKIDHPEFSESIKNGKQKADAEVANKLYHRALGYEHEEDQIFQYKGEPVVVPTVKHYPPDPTAAIFWLKNRQKDKWRDRHEQEITGKDGGPLEVEVRGLTDEELEAKIQRLINKSS